MQKRILMAVILCALGMGCQQDPYATQPDSIKKGIPPEDYKKPEPPKYVGEDWLKIDVSAPSFVFKEGEEASFTIKGRCLAPNTPFDLEILNLADFPGATFDAAAGVFKWRPPIGTVDRAQTDYSYLKIRAITKSPLMTANLVQTVFVSRALVVPEVVSYEKEKLDHLKPIMEGESREFKVAVRDSSALDIDGKRPRLVAVAQNGDTLAPFIVIDSSKQPVVDPADKSLYTFKVKLDLSENYNRLVELTRDENDLGFTLVAVSRFGETSVPYAIKTKVQSKLRKPLSSWASTVVPEFTAGKVGFFAFTVYDPQAEDTGIEVGLKGMTNYPGDFRLDCGNQSIHLNTRNCQIFWKVDATAPTKNYLVAYDVRNKSRDGNRIVTVEFKNEIRVVAPPPEMKMAKGKETR